MPSSLPPTTRDYIGRTAGFPEVSVGDDHDSLAIGLDRVEVFLGANVIREVTEERGRARGRFFVRDRCFMLMVDRARITSTAMLQRHSFNARSSNLVSVWDSGAASFLAQSMSGNHHRFE
ncbi:hypothetical protein MY3957_002148 [Beauveria namnaoensis]